MPVEFKKMFFEGNYNLKVLSKAVEAKQRKKMRDTRSETRIKKGKKRQEKTEHYLAKTPNGRNPLRQKRTRTINQEQRNEHGTQSRKNVGRTSVKA